MHATAIRFSMQEFMEIDGKIYMPIGTDEQQRA